MWPLGDERNRQNRQVLTLLAELTRERLGSGSKELWEKLSRTGSHSDVMSGRGIAVAGISARSPRVRRSACSNDEEEAERIVFAICAVCCLIFLVGVVAFLFVGANDGESIASYRSTHATNHCTTSHPYSCGTGSWHTNVYAKSADKGHARSDKASDESIDNSTHSRPDCSAYA
ncbi:hypothetical protein MRX96_014956 [Rhipicephalus microplus]